MKIPQLEDFLEEACTSKHLTHPNILSTLGIVWPQRDRPLVVLPFMAKGDLCALLRKDELVSISVLTFSSRLGLTLHNQPRSHSTMGA